MVLFIEKHNFFPCSFAFFLVRKWKKQEHLRWPTGPAGGPGDIGFQYFWFKTHSEKRKIKMGPEDLREKLYRKAA